MYTFADLPTNIKNRITFEKYEKSPFKTLCWKWNGPLHGGYGRITRKGFVTQKAHRVIYLLFGALIPSGYELDHLCHNRACVNPGHLEPVTRLENVRRSHATGDGNGGRTHCRQGHEFTPANIYRWHGKRFCLKCQRIRQRIYENKKAEAENA